MNLKEKLLSVLALLKAEINGKADQATVSSLSTSMADAFSQSASYAVGDLCMKDGILYKCTQAHSAGAWNAAHFTATSVASEKSGPQQEMLFVDQTTGRTYRLYVNNGNFVLKEQN